MKTISLYYGDVTQRNCHTIHDNDISVSDGYFVFPTKAFAHTECVSFKPESAYNDIHFRFRVSLRNIAVGARLGFQFKNMTDGFDGEHVTFVFADGNINLYTNNTLRNNYGAFNLQSLEGQEAEFLIRRENDHYKLYFNGQEYDRQIFPDGALSVYRENISPAIYGSGLEVRPLIVSRYTVKDNPKFALLGDSIGNGLTSGNYEQTVGGRMTLQYGYSFEDFAGSANVTKDLLDAMTDIGMIRPQYAFIMIGHNDLFFATGQFEVNFPILIRKLKNYGITPIICNCFESQWVDISPINEYIENNYFNSRFLHVDMNPVLIQPTDFLDGAHPTSAGQQKFADALNNFIIANNL